MKVILVFAFITGCLCAFMQTANAQDCAMFCAEYYKPVCGSDGHTYSNTCFLQIAQCHDNTITQAHTGSCGSQTLRPACPNVMCIALYDPVCGSDGKTYSNSCHLHAANCHGNITLAHRGACGTIA